VEFEGDAVRILIADDHGIVRQGLKSLIDEQPDMEVVGEAEDGLQAAELADRLLPDVVLMDISMQNLNGIEATRLIRRGNPQIKIVALSIHTNKQYIVDMLRAGASGYVLKTCPFSEVARAIRAVSSGQHYLSPKVNELVLGDYLEHLVANGASEKDRLTDRQRQVIQLLAEGRTTKQIANLLHVSSKTVEAARRQAMNSLGVSSVAELTKFAIREGLTAVES